MSAQWTTAREYTDIKYETTDDGSIAKITINRPQVRNAFRPQTVHEMLNALNAAHEDPKVGVVILTGEGPDAFCSGGDQKVRGNAGYIGEDGVPRLNILDVQRTIRTMPKPVVAMVAGYAIGGGHVLHVVCDLTIAADNAKFGQTGPKVGSFDGGLGSSYLARIVGQKKAREIWYLCRQYDAQQALDMGLVNTVVPLDRLEEETLSWCREMLRHSPLALRCLKASRQNTPPRLPLPRPAGRVLFRRPARQGTGCRGTARHDGRNASPEIARRAVPLNRRDVSENKSRKKRE